MILNAKLLVISMTSALLLSACGKPDTADAIVPSGGDADSSSLQADLAPMGWADATTQFESADGAPMGYVMFKSVPNGGVLLRIDISGLTPGWHGIHLHQKADCSDGADGFKASGSHINPGAKAHGLLNPDGYEAADMPNIFAGADGRATAEIFNADASLDGDAAVLRDADGFAIIVHESPDDHMTQPIGGAGKRVACAALTAQ